MGENASEDIANSAFGSFKSAVEIIQGIIDNNLDYQPTIRPVLDTSSIESGAGMINSIFSQTETIGLGGYLNPFIPRTLGQITSNMGYDEPPLYVDNSDIIQAIRDLGEEFETIKNAIAQMKVVMDKNALVGEIIDRVDSELGKKSTYNARRL